MVVGRRAEDDEKYGPEDDPRKLFQATDERAKALGVQYMYGCIKSLDAVGTVEKVSFKLSTMRYASVDLEMLDAIGWTDQDVGHYGSIIYYNNQHYKFMIPYTTIEKGSPLSFTVGPQLKFE